MRVKLTDLSSKRIFEALDRRLKDISHSRNWDNSNFGKTNKEALLSFHNKHLGERCFIIANGPSLNNLDLSFLKDEITFGMNRLYLIFDKIGFVPTYYSIINELVIEQFADDIASLPTNIFVNWSQRHLFSQDNIHYLRPYLKINDEFSFDITKGVYSGGTVTYATLQLAYFMGFKEVFLIGLDHNFADKGRPNATEVRKEAEDKNHFHPDYFPKGIKWQLPDLYRSELSYALARQAFEKDGRKVFDATVDGRCQIFEKVDYADIFNKFPKNK